MNVEYSLTSGSGWVYDTDAQSPQHMQDNELADANNLLYLRSRYYNPELGQFISQDPVEGNPAEPMTLNRYAYAEQNPVNRTDPSGLWACSDLTGNPAAQIDCLRKIRELSQNFGITLSEDENLSPQGKDNWTSPRVSNVYDALQAINGKLGGITKQAVGNTEMLLVKEGVGYGAAITSLCNRVRLYLDFTDANGKKYINHIHTVDNIIHELGHVLTLSSPTGRTAYSAIPGPSAEMPNRPIALWGQIQTYRRFDEQAGWDPSHRQSQENIPDEVVPDMFLYWVKGYGFPADEYNFGQARNAFMDGKDIPGKDGKPLPRINDGTPINDGTIFHSAGVVSFVRKMQAVQQHQPA